MIDKREINEYNFIRSKFNVPMEKWELVYNTFHLMADKNIFLNNLVLLLIYDYTKDFNHYLTTINILYNSQDHQMPFGYELPVICSILKGITRNRDKNIKYYNDLDDVMNLIDELNLDNIDYGNKTDIIYSVISYYWIYRDKIDFNKIIDFLKHIINDSYHDIFMNNGIIDKKGNLLVNNEVFIEYLNALLQSNSLILNK